MWRHDMNARPQGHVALNTHSQQQEAAFSSESDHIMLANLVTLEVELPRMDQPLRGLAV